LSSFSLSYLESDFFKILESFVASHWKDIFVKIVELLIVASSDNAKHEWIGAIFFNYLILETYGKVNLFNRSGEESWSSECYVSSVDLNEIFGLRKFFFILWLLGFFISRWWLFIDLHFLHHFLDGGLLFLLRRWIKRWLLSTTSVGFSTSGSAGLSLILYQYVI